MTSLTSNDVSPRQARIERVCAEFSGSPRLRAMAVQQVQAWLDRQFRALNLTADAVAVGTPVGADAQSPGPYRDHTYTRLPDLLLERLVSVLPVHFIEGYHRVAKRVRESYIVGGPGLAEVEQLVNQRGPFLLLVWQALWQTWWQQSVAGQVSRFAYLADGLLALMYDSPKPAGMTDQQFCALFPRHLMRAAQSVRTTGLPGAQLHIQTLHVRLQSAPAREPAYMLPVLLLKHQVLGADTSTLLLFSPAAGVRTLYRPDDAFGLLPDALRTQGASQVLEWSALEPLVDPFEVLAAACAQEQRREVEAIAPSADRTPEQLQTLLDHIIDPRRWFTLALTPLQQRLQDGLPLWLVHADDQDVKAYVHHLTALAVAQHEAAGRDFLEGVPQIKAFAEHLLQQCLDAEPNAAGARAADIGLKFTQVVGTGMPGGFAVGGIQHLSMSLTELALENLVGFAHPAVAITVKGQPASTRLTYALLKGCVTQANVGQRYPDLLKRTFITDATEATRREQLFVAQLRAQLPLLALEQKIKGAQGFTAEGYRWLAAAVQATQALRNVDGQAAALWPLAFKARPGDSADGVVNMYIIGPAAGEGGPHLLYRPLLQPVLCEYPSLEALFAAIKVAGPLHDAVLDWIAPARRHVYANGGFAEPRIGHALQGDEFTPPSRPEPAQLSQQLVVGDPLHHVFVGTVQALVTLADAQSVSNAQARWATLKAGGWLLFGEVLPMLSGPAGLAGWLFQLMASLQQDTQAQVEGDPADKRQATADLLFNLVTVLGVHMTPADAPPRHVPEHAAYEPGLPSAPKRVEPSTRVVNNTRPSGWFNGADVLHPTLQARLEAMSLGSGAVKGVLETGGALKGLFRDGTQWQAQVRGRRYRVQVSEGSVRVVSADGETLGPWLKRVDDAYWDIDLRLRLAGGNADEAIAERQRADNDNVPRLEADLASLREQIESADKAIDVAHGLLSSPQIGEAQRTTVHERFVRELKRKHDSMLLELQVLKRLRSKGPRRGYEQELCSTLENLILTEQLLSAQMRIQTMRINNALRPALDRAEAVEDNATRTPDQRRDEMEIVEGLRQLAEINDDALRWRALQDRHLQELREVPRFGRDRAAALSPGTDNQPSLMDLHSLQLTNLWALSLDSSHTAIDEVFLQDVNKLVERARWAIRSHTSLESLTFATDAERIELVENINQVYGETSDSLEYWREMRPEYFHAPYVEKLQQLLDRMHYEAESHLTDLLSAIRTPTPPPPPTRVRPAKKIIRIRNHDMLVTTIKEPSAESPQEVAELKDENQQVLASFTQAADGMWEQVTAPVARPVAGPRLNHLMEQGQTLLEQVEPSISRVLKQAPTANEPQSLQDILDQQASTLRECARAINQRLLQDDVSQLAATQRAKAQTRAHALTAAASRLAEQGLQARVTAVKARPPTQGGVDFLFSQREVQIYRIDERVPLKGRRNDFLQVYGVFDTHDHQPLCYAHFHYESAKALNDHFTAAHLKTPEQHRLGKQAQAKAQEQANVLIQAGQSGRAQPNLAIYRSEINLRMARGLFFDATSWQGWW